MSHIARHRIALLRPASRRDAPGLARLINIAGEGIPYFLWSGRAASGEDPMLIGAARAARDEGAFSWVNATVASHGDSVVGMLLAYRLPPRQAGDADEIKAAPEFLRPLLELELEVPESYYINALAVEPDWREQGIGSRLLAEARMAAARQGCRELSIQVFSQNTRAAALYRRHGFVERASRPLVPHDCYPYDDRTVLMTRPV